FEADVTRLQLLVIQDADAAVPVDLVALEREIHLLDAVVLGARAECRLCSRRAAAEQNAVVSFHLCVSRASAIIASAMGTSGRRYRAGESLEDFCRACKTDRLH